MIHQIVKSISAELEKLAQYNISVERALDLIEASTDNLDELVAINTMRESMQELELQKQNRLFPHPAFISRKQTSTVVYH